MLEEKYFEKFKNLGKYLAYADMLDIINHLLESSCNYTLTNTLADLRTSTIIKIKEALEKC